MFIDGPQGQLETRLDQAEVAQSATRTSSTTAILCHPHPLYGGSMHDQVLDTLAQILLARSINCIRFNFRGVGASAGSHEGGAGEVNDLLAVVDWVQAEFPNDQLWLAGYSFGAHVVWQTLAKSSVANDVGRDTAKDVSRALLIAPPNAAMAFTPQSTDAQVHAFAGDRDDYVQIDQLHALRGVQAHIIAGADHFFTGCHGQLSDCIIKNLEDA